MKVNVQEMLAAYERHSAAARYFIVVKYKDDAFLANVTTIPESWLKLDRMSSSHGGHVSLRMQVGATMAYKLVMTGKVSFLCKWSEIEKLAPRNVGDKVEQYVTERIARKAWKADRSRWWEAGDVEIDGEQVQVKFGANATLCHVGQLERLGEAVEG